MRGMELNGMVVVMMWMWVMTDTGCRRSTTASNRRCVGRQLVVR